MGEEEEKVMDLNLLSIGSKNHPTMCRPCHYVHTASGCMHGQGCRFCHVPHEKKTRFRPCKNKRLQCKKYIQMLDDVSRDDPESLGEAVQHACARSAYLNDMMSKRSPSAARAASDATTEINRLVSSVTSTWAVGLETPAPARRKNIVSI